MMKKYNKLLFKASIFGTIIGAIPGIGAVTGSWVGYSAAERSSKSPGTFGKGNIEGIIGAESANNATVPGTFIPLLSLGIPGSAANAIILGAFMAAGIYPGPALIQNNGPVVWTILFGIGLSAFVFLLLGVPFIKMAQMMVVLPNEYLIAFIGILAMLGTYLSKFSVFGALITILIGLLMMGGSKFGLIPSSVLLGYILGPTIEVEFIRAYQIGGFTRFLEPISVVLLIITLATLIWGLVKNRKRKKADKASLNEKQKAEQEFLEQLDDESVDNSSHLGDLVFGVLGLCLSAYICYALRDIAFLGRFWPLIIAIFFLGVPCIIMIARAITSTNDIMRTFAKMTQGVSGTLLSKTTLDFIVIIGGLALCTLLIDTMGFVGASILFSIIVLAFFGRSPTRTVIGTVAFGLAMWAMRVSLGFPLPKGFLGL